MTPVSRKNTPLLVRHPKNPILTANDWPYRANTIFNAGATLLSDGTTLLLCRVEDMRGHSHLTVARSKDGISNWEIDPEPTMAADFENYPEEIWGIEDPRHQISITATPTPSSFVVVYAQLF